jgi:hypothetical protein
MSAKLEEQAAKIEEMSAKLEEQAAKIEEMSAKLDKTSGRNKPAAGARGARPLSHKFGRGKSAKVSTERSSVSAKVPTTCWNSIATNVQRKPVLVPAK